MGGSLLFSLREKRYGDARVWLDVVDAASRRETGPLAPPALRAGIAAGTRLLPGARRGGTAIPPFRALPWIPWLRFCPRWATFVVAFS